MFFKFIGTTLSILGFFGGFFCIVMFFKDMSTFPQEFLSIFRIVTGIGLIGSCGTLALGLMLRIKGNKAIKLEKQALAAKQN